MKRQHPQSAYLGAGLDLLERDGYGGLKLSALCAELEITSGAFYHNFENWSEYTSALIDHWRHDHTTTLVGVIEEQAMPSEQLETLLKFTLHLRHRVEAAIRAWSTVDADVARVQAVVDKDRIDVAREVIARFRRPAPADRLARSAHQALVGFQVVDGSTDASALETSLRLVIREVLDPSSFE